MISPADGNESDPSMDSDAMEFLLKNVGPEESTVVIDSKGANSKLIAKMMEGNLGFVTKAPVNFSSCLKKRLSLEVFKRVFGDCINATSFIMQKAEMRTKYELYAKRERILEERLSSIRS